MNIIKYLLKSKDKEIIEAIKQDIKSSSDELNVIDKIFLSSENFQKIFEDHSYGFLERSLAWHLKLEFKSSSAPTKEILFVKELIEYRNKLIDELITLGVLDG